MLVEALVHATTRAAPGARAAGLVYEQAALVGRWLRHRHAWRPHLENCRRAIRDAADMTARRDCAVVLGSGPLLDIPLAFLSRRFARVVLVDAAQPLHARLHARRFRNVDARAESLVDLEGGARRYRPWRGRLPAPDLVVASMLLSQLPLLRAGGDAAGAEAGGALIRAAVDEILAGPGAVCLVTETRRRHRAVDGRVLAEEDPLLGVVPPAPTSTWRWDLAPAGEAGPAAVELDVAASLRRG